MGFVGVGDEDFQKLYELDGDNTVLRNAYGKPCKRDIVQFVPYKKAIEKGDLAK